MTRAARAPTVRHATSTSVVATEGLDVIIGLGIFALMAVLLVVAFLKVKAGDRRYEQGE